jgi:ABC-type uncharacterized transport system involved in gliding motility auxiliary subunit
MNRRFSLGVGGLVLLAVLFVGLTVLSNSVLRGVRFDLTQNHLYSIAPGTDRILKGLNEPINLYLYFSEAAANKDPRLKTYGERVRGFLEDLVTRAHGKLRLTVIDPQPFSEDEDRASRGRRQALLRSRRYQLD